MTAYLLPHFVPTLLPLYKSLKCNKELHSTLTEVYVRLLLNLPRRKEYSHLLSFVFPHFRLSWVKKGGHILHFHIKIFHNRVHDSKISIILKSIPPHCVWMLYFERFTTDHPPSCLVSTFNTTIKQNEIQKSIREPAPSFSLFKDQLNFPFPFASSSSSIYLNKRKTCRFPI